MEEERLLKVFLGERPCRADRLRHRPARSARRAAGWRRMPGRADHGNHPQSYRHDARLLASGGRTRRHAAPDRRRLQAYRLCRGADGSAFAAPPGRLPPGDRSGRPVRSASGDHHADPVQPSLGRELLRDALAKTPNLDAVFCNNDDLALGVLFECNRAFIKVPQTIGIAGFNDLDMMQAGIPVADERAHLSL